MWRLYWIPGMQYTAYYILHILLFWLLYTASCINTVFDEYIFCQLMTTHFYLSIPISNPLNWWPRVEYFTLLNFITVLLTKTFELPVFFTVQTLSRFGFQVFLFFFSMSREEDSTSGAATNPGVINTVSLMLPTFCTEKVEV